MTKEQAIDELQVMRSGYTKFVATPAGKMFVEWLGNAEASKLEAALKTADSVTRLQLLDQAKGIRGIREHFDAMTREPRTLSER